MLALSVQQDIIRVLLDRHGRTFCDELGIPLHRNRPRDYFQLLCAVVLMSTRIRYSVAVTAARGLFEHGWKTVEALAASSHADRVMVLDAAHYVRYDETRSTMLGELCRLLIVRYQGDLRKLRREAEFDPIKERSLLKEFKGIGNTGVDIFFREVQMVWGELYPFIDAKAADAARVLGLPDDANTLAKIVGKPVFPRLVAALVRTNLEGDFEEIVMQSRTLEALARPQ
jgi:endonuclease III